MVLIAAVLTAALTVVAASGCGGTSSSPSQSSSATGSVVVNGDVTVSVQGFKFTPQNVSVPVGATVTWMFQDSVDHNVVADDNSFRSANLSAGKTYARTFDKAGTFPYRCTLHSYMTGTVTVR